MAGAVKLGARDGYWIYFGLVWPALLVKAGVETLRGPRDATGLAMLASCLVVHVLYACRFAFARVAIIVAHLALLGFAVKGAHDFLTERPRSPDEDLGVSLILWCLLNVVVAVKAYVSPGNKLAFGIRSGARELEVHEREDGERTQ